jgi:hypothetical protein
MSPKHHPTPLSGGDRKALSKELRRSAGIERMLQNRSIEARARGEALIREADKLACESWNERMWREGGPIDPSPTVDQAINGGCGWLQVRCSRCRADRSVELAALPHVTTTCVHDLASRLICDRCKTLGLRPKAELLQLWDSRR